jgi:hypothetical protein
MSSFNLVHAPKFTTASVFLVRWSNLTLGN